MGTPTEVLAQFSHDLRDKMRVTIDRPGLPDARGGAARPRADRGGPPRRWARDA